MNLEEYRKNLQKQITLPSGLPVTIRKMSPFVAAKFAEVLKKHQLKLENVDAMELLIHIKDIADVIFPACVITPKITTGEPTIDTLSVDELSFQDMTMLLTEILSFSGLAEKSAEETFRKK